MSGNTYQDQMYRDIRLIWDNDEPIYRHIVVTTQQAESRWHLAEQLRLLYATQTALACSTHPLVAQILRYQPHGLFDTLADEYWAELRPEGENDDL